MSRYASALLRIKTLEGCPISISLCSCAAGFLTIVTFGKLSVMTRRLAHHLGLRLLGLVMSGVILAPKVIHAYNVTRNDNVRP